MRPMPLMLLLLAVLPAAAQDVVAPRVMITPSASGPGNLPPDFYPKSPCAKPDPASIGDKPRDVRDLKAVTDFNNRVQTYNKVAQAFNGCVTGYADRAQNDIARIQAAIRDANTH